MNEQTAPDAGDLYLAAEMLELLADEELIASSVGPDENAAINASLLKTTAWLRRQADDDWGEMKPQSGDEPSPFCESCE